MHFECVALLCKFACPFLLHSVPINSLDGFMHNSNVKLMTNMFNEFFKKRQAIALIERLMFINQPDNGLFDFDRAYLMVPIGFG